MGTETKLIPASTRGMSLWAIDEELQNLMERAQLEEEETGAMAPETAEALQVYFSSALTKVDSIAGFLKLEKVIESAYKAEKHRLEARWRAYENSFTRCKNMMLEFLRGRNETKIKGATNTISRQANSQASLEITDADKIPAAYKRMTMTVKAPFWEALMKLYKESEDALVPVGMILHSMTEVSPAAFVDHRAVCLALEACEDFEGAELKYGEHIRVR